MRYKTLGWIVVGAFIALLALPFVLLAADQAWIGVKRADIDTPTLPSQVAVTGVAATEETKGGKNLWFQSHSDGTYESELKDGYYSSPLVRVGSDEFLYADDEQLVFAQNLRGGEERRLQPGYKLGYMISGITSDSGEHALVMSNLSWNDPTPRENGTFVYTLTDGEREKSILLDYEAFSSVVTDDGQALIVTPDDNFLGFCVTTFSYEEEKNTECLEPLVGKYLNDPIVDVIDGSAKLFSEWITDEQSKGWVLYEQTDRGWELVNEQQATEETSPGKRLESERSFTKEGKVYWFTEEPGLSSFAFPTREDSELEIHHDSLADVMDGELMSFTVDGDIIHCVSARKDQGEDAQFVSSFNLKDLTKHTGPWLIPRTFETRGIFDVPRPITVIYFTDDATLQQLGVTR
ncbi:hypothetical protein [Corynebacterium glucuronolyticum]|uniref:Uncharacterized protein n=2 Tax=Corynebacterium glucuronolyticum TaxID=39791 RepID=A0A7T4EE39_9CORY|nr:hypothetical protein [Corynebacterium glucuronolyticum]EEI26593.1 hypothetical protein HMPREF0294_2009 [Corynebacterium glucuronolyticum ATCC 51867]EEI62947.1 hypothetical protein HMPREF0293_1465 [Corynebacterium glucuronolyticum ATCC 51866]QQB45695.1 hypothetical protein I6I10_09320 [Corynebacterium glucuronolyticum]QRO83203.1 hypothetical protein I6J20_03335 [Corynebacterium glucuronolyticum]QRP69551.1 hypothetical protein I6J21_06820 [Corynebacterium glucuronolyticum]